MKLLKGKKGQDVGGVQGFVLGIVGVAVVLAVGLIVLAELQSSADTSSDCAGNATLCNEAYSATGDIMTKLGTVPTWVGILITVALAFIVLSFFARSR